VLVLFLELGAPKPAAAAINALRETVRLATKSESASFSNAMESSLLPSRP